MRIRVQVRYELHLDPDPDKWGRVDNKLITGIELNNFSVRIRILHAWV